MVSEFMLQQTPVSRVLPVYAGWLARWPRPADLAAESPGEAVRAWGRLGYPRRALRLHAAATAIEEQHGGEVPHEHARAGPARRRRVHRLRRGLVRVRPAASVLDTNVRRVFARAVTGVEYPPTSTTAAERGRPGSCCPLTRTSRRGGRRPRWNSARSCAWRAPPVRRCPIASQCAWRLAGSPAHEGPPRRVQSYAGTDRQVRGKLLAVLREASRRCRRPALDAVWHEPVQRARALDGLVSDGLVEPLAGGVPAAADLPRPPARPALIGGPRPADADRAALSHHRE